MILAWPEGPRAATKKPFPKILVLTGNTNANAYAPYLPKGRCQKRFNALFEGRMLLLLIKNSRNATLLRSYWQRKTNHRSENKIFVFTRTWFSPIDQALWGSSKEFNLAAELQQRALPVGGVLYITAVPHEAFAEKQKKHGINLDIITHTRLHRVRWVQRSFSVVHLMKILHFEWLLQTDEITRNSWLPCPYVCLQYLMFIAMGSLVSYRLCTARNATSKKPRPLRHRMEIYKRGSPVILFIKEDSRRKIMP